MAFDPRQISVFDVVATTMIVFCTALVVAALYALWAT